MTSKPYTIQPTQACQLQVGDQLESMYGYWTITAIEPAPFGQLAITLAHPEDAAITTTRKFGITAMTSKLVK